jgi:hypothetical protein
MAQNGLKNTGDSSMTTRRQHRLGPRTLERHRRIKQKYSPQVSACLHQAGRDVKLSSLCANRLRGLFQALPGVTPSAFAERDGL